MRGNTLSTVIFLIAAVLFYHALRVKDAVAQAMRHTPAMPLGVVQAYCVALNTGFSVSRHNEHCRRHGGPLVVLTVEESRSATRYMQPRLQEVLP